MVEEKDKLAWLRDLKPLSLSLILPVSSCAVMVLRE